MKSTFLKMSAKVAFVGVLCGGLLSGCYKKGNDDVNGPYTPPVAVYSISGTVYDAVANMPLSGVTVQFTNGSTVLTATTTSGGSYSLTTTVAGTYTVALTKTDYITIAASTSLTVSSLANGQNASYLLNAVLAPTTAAGFAGLPIQVLTSGTTGTSQAVFDATTDLDVDVVNDGGSVVNVPFTILMDKGGRFVSDNLGVEPPSTRAADDDALKAYITQLLTWLYGTLPVNRADDFTRGEMTYTLQLPPQYSLKTITVTTKYNEMTLTFTYKGVAYQIVITGPYSYEITSSIYPNGIYHGHGHGGHGHGTLNAGGGVINGI